MLSKHSCLVCKHFSTKFPLTSVRLSVKLFASCVAKNTRMSKHGIPRFPESCLKITCKKYKLSYRYYRDLDRLYYSDDRKQCCFALDCQNIRSSTRINVFSCVSPFLKDFCSSITGLKKTSSGMHPLLENFFHLLS